MLSGPPRRRRARPVADAPVEELLARAEDVAKGWLLALLEDQPLEDAAAISTAGVTQDGPRICAAVLRALRDDRDLRRLEAGGVLEPLVSQCAAYAGPQSGSHGALRAVDALHGVLWSAMHADLRDAEPEQVSDLAQRLAAAIELVRAAALRRPWDSASAGDAGDAASSPRPFPRAPLRPVTAPPPAEPAVTAPPVADEPAAAEPPEAGEDVVPEPPPTARAGAAPPPAPAPPPGGDTPLWVEALDEELTRSRRSGASLSLVLAELSDGPAAADAHEDGATAFSSFAQAVRTVLRRQDLLASETTEKVWVIARDTGRAGATALAQRMAAAVSAEGLDADDGRGLRIGVAVFGEDADDCAALLEAARQASLAADPGATDSRPGE